MLIRYTGTRLQKVVNVAGKDFLFNPICEFNPIFDAEIVKWLLHKDRAGLFVVEDVEDKTPSQTQPEMTHIPEKEAESKAETPVVTPKTEKEGQHTPKRRRPKKRG